LHGVLVVDRLMSQPASDLIARLGLDQVVRNAPFTISVIDLSGRVLHTNRAWELTVRQLGVEMPKDLDNGIDIFHPDGRRYERHDWPAVRSIATGEEILGEDFFYALPDGGRLPMRCSCSPVRDEDGRIVAVVVTMTDVTEQTRRDERLTYLAELLDNSEDAVIAMDARYHLTVWSTGAERLYGWKADEVIGRHVDEVARTNLTDVQRTELRQELATTGRWRGKVTVARKDGATVEAELVSVALLGVRGETTGYLTIHRDVSERRHAEETLQAGERQSAAILEIVTDAFVAVDSDWRYTDVNDRALDRMRERRGPDLVREDVIGRNMWELFPEVLDSEVERRYRKVMRERRPDAFETYFGFSGEWIEAHAYPTAAGIAIYYRNVNARRRAEEALREAQEQRALANRRLDDVREAERRRIARDLHDEALQELVDALVQADRGRSAGLGPEAAGRLASTLRRVNEHVRGAIYGLRLSDDTSRSFPEALRALVDVHRAMAVDCAIDLDIRWDPPTDPAGGRGLEILRIVGEALTNARRHSDARHVRVKAHRSEEHIVVEVADDGRGFGSDAAALGASGMGIEGMRERAAALGADLDVRSAPARGTTIRLEVRRPQDREALAAQVRILVVEDNPASREAIAYMLGQEPDLEVVGQAASLAEARGMLRDVDVAVIDLGLPDGFGGDLISDLHSLNPHAQAIVLSASVDPTEIARASKSGARLTIAKTADFDELVRAIRRSRRPSTTTSGPTRA
jgi:PAS domain S-box-containing protein